MRVWGGGVSNLRAWRLPPAPLHNLTRALASALGPSLRECEPPRVTGEEAETLAEPRAIRVPSPVSVSAGGFTLAAADRTVDGGHAGQGGPL